MAGHGSFEGIVRPDGANRGGNVTRPNRGRRWLSAAVFLLALSLHDGRAQAPPTRPEQTDEVHWTVRRSWIITAAALVVVLVFGLGELQFLLRQAQYQDQFTFVQDARSYVSLVSRIVFIVTSVAAAWTVLPYGSSKNRTDTSAALLVFGILIIISTIATGIYRHDLTTVSYCTGRPPGFPEYNEELKVDCSAPSMAIAGVNAEEVQRITTLSSLGQIVPLLSISKDILQSWFAPPGLDEAANPRGEERKRARRARRASAEPTRLSWTPAWLACIFALGLWALFITSLYLR